VRTIALSERDGWVTMKMTIVGTDDYAWVPTKRMPSLSMMPWAARSAERRIGELMAELREAGKLAKGAQGRGPGRGKIGASPKDAPFIDDKTLKDMGIDKHLADRARKAAAMPLPRLCLV
jgi:hypothetical protein